jgi:FMN phosphatase YigB (HAD superfamily)
VVISGEVGLRKPDRAVFLLVAERLGLPPHRCVFVDDTKGNVKAAEAVGMRGIVHERAEVTIGKLRSLLGVRIRLRDAGSVGTIVEST